MLSLSASHAETVVHAVTTTVATTEVRVVMTIAVHAVTTTVVHAAHVVSVLPRITSRTTNLKCSNLKTILEKQAEQSKMTFSLFSLMAYTELYRIKSSFQIIIHPFISASLADCLPLFIIGLFRNIMSSERKC